MTFHSFGLQNMGREKNGSHIENQYSQIEKKAYFFFLPSFSFSLTKQLYNHLFSFPFSPSLSWVSSIFLS